MPRTVLLSVATGAALALGGALLNIPAYGSVQQECDNTAINITTSPASPVNGATTVTINAHVTDLDQTPLTPVGNVVFRKDNAVIGSAVALNGAGNASTSTLMTTGIHTLTAQYSGGAANNVMFCGSVSGSVPYIVNSATPTTTPVPPPAGNGNVTYQTCAAAFRAGAHDLRRGIDAGYATRLDRDGDGIACEKNGDDNPVTVIKPGPTTIVNPPPAAAPNTTIIVPPAPSGSNYSQIGQAPAGAASTGFGPNA